MAAALALTILVDPFNAADVAHRPTSQWVYPGTDGKLVYKTTPAGDRIMDFSHAGYRGGGVALPIVPVKRTVRPSDAGDDTAIIQKGINEVAALPLEGGFRGTVLLSPGTFTCSETISITASGVVLRGSGSAADGGTRTTIKMTGKPHTAIIMRAPGGGRGGRDDNATADPSFKPAATMIADAYVPSGVRSFTVSDATGFAVGDTVEIRRPVTEAWIKFMEMHDLVRDGRPQTWIRAGSTTSCERRIAGISGNKITVDVPVSDSFDAKYLNPPGTRVVRIIPLARLSQAGIENLHIESPPQAISHTQPHFTALRINGQDCWARDLVIDETMNSVAVSGCRLTLQRVTVIRKALHQGSSRPAEFAPNASQVLLDRCSVNADNVWYVATGGGQAGPMVLLNCIFQGNGRAESHQRWSTGMLYDNCRVPGGGVDFRNRGSMGSGHGWSMGWGVAWNCVAEDYVIQNPPGAANWMIGCTGRSRPMPRPFGSGPYLPEGIIDAHGTPVTPASLYLAQLAERLGPQALKNIDHQPSTPGGPFKVPGMWEYSAPLIAPEARDSNRSRAQKDPTVVFYGGKWHVFMTVKLPAKTAIEYCSFTRWEEADASSRTILKISDSDYYCAPQVFYFKPHKKWYLVYQMGVPGANKMWVAYSTTADIANPGTWTRAMPILDGGKDDPRKVGGLDYWIICESHLRFIFQGMWEKHKSGKGYGQFQWRIGLLTPVAVRAADTKVEPTWRTLPLITEGKVDDGWCHVGWGGFAVDDGALRTECDPKGLGLLVYQKERFGNCQLCVVFKSKDAKCNAGVFVRIDDGILAQVNQPGAAFDRDDKGKISAESGKRMMASGELEEGPWFAVHRGYEVQIMDANDKFHRTGAIYSLAASSAVSQKAAGEWKTMIITLAGNRIFVELEGRQITRFDPANVEVPGSRQWFEPKREPKRPEVGYLGLQNHDLGDIVWFKEISVRPLPDEDVK